MIAPPIKLFSIVLLALTGLGTMAQSAKAAVVIRAIDATLSAIADPGGIAGDGAYATTTPSWRIVNDTVQVAVDSSRAVDPHFQARGIVQFGMPALSDGTYDLSMLLKTENIKYSAAGGARDQSFAVRLLALGSAKLNGVVAGNSGWIIVKPLTADNTGGGHVVPWLDLDIAGSNNTDFAISGGWNTALPFSLEGADGVNGSLRIEVLDGTGLNYGSLSVSNFTFTAAVPEPRLSVAVLFLFAVTTAMLRHGNGRRRRA